MNHSGRNPYTTRQATVAGYLRADPITSIGHDEYSNSKPHDIDTLQLRPRLAPSEGVHKGLIEAHGLARFPDFFKLLGSELFAHTRYYSLALASNSRLPRCADACAQCVGKSKQAGAASKIPDCIRCCRDRLNHLTHLNSITFAFSERQALPKAHNSSLMVSQSN